ncbi:hypothetical protein [Streptomyces sp. KN37]|uniref:hypothetical protein n=1 Tax=Streptomyces sp. KN37 TaxID=3090667 RepID=UPI002A7550E0|nr:hypothetical protein [Streptomyces sp. KN37]WPO70176.1 hypothetical protein R9806_05820 [Streptomyces sp. KN37]WPO74053.1 hypothetical protein R9806_27240 [Streptomyces sp. KN37]
MIPTPPVCRSERSAAVVNEEIRELLRRTGGWLYGPSRARYAVLVAEWATVSRAESLQSEIVEAA